MTAPKPCTAGRSARPTSPGSTPPARRSRSRIWLRTARSSCRRSARRSATFTSRSSHRTRRGSCCSRSSRCSNDSRSTPTPMVPRRARSPCVFAAAARDRDRHLADPDHMTAHPSTLLDDGHLASLADEIRLERPAPLGSRSSGDTIALVAADSEGFAVSLIQSLFWGFGSGICEPATGIVAQNRGACFTLEPGHPNTFAPGKLPAHTLMPVLVHDERGVAAVAGSMGGYAAASDQRADPAPPAGRRRARGRGRGAALDPRTVRAGIAGADRHRREHPGGGAAVPRIAAVPGGGGPRSLRRARACPPDPGAPRRVRCGRRPSVGWGLPGRLMDYAVLVVAPRARPLSDFGWRRCRIPR